MERLVVCIGRGAAFTTPGYRWQAEVMMIAVEVMSMLGVKAPTK